jgi:nucleoside-diphosphate-sugar epimerase
MVVGITGASGFIGSALLQRHLEAGDRVRCLTRRARLDAARGAVTIQGDLSNPDASLIRFAEGLDVLYHCAAEVGHQDRMRAVNVEGTRALVQAAEGRIGRWVQLSSVGVYGPHRDGVVVEETPIGPVGTYEETKAAADSLVLDAARKDRLASTVILRPSIVFGEGMPNHSISQWAEVIDRGLFFFIGRPGASANYVHIRNVVDALVLCSTAPAAHGRVYNLSDWCTVEAFACAIADVLRRPRPAMRLPERPVRVAVRAVGRVARLPLTESRIDALVSRHRYPITRIQRELDFQIALPIVDGLARMLTMRRAA